MESLVAALGNYPLLQIMGAVVIIAAALFAMRKGAIDSGKEEPVVTEADLLRLRQTINDEQGESRRRLWESITSLHNALEAERERQRERHDELAQRVAAVEALTRHRR